MAVLQGEAARQAMARARRRARLASTAPATSTAPSAQETQVPARDVVVPLPTTEGTRADLFRRTADRLLAG